MSHIPGKMCGKSMLDKLLKKVQPGCLECRVSRVRVTRVKTFGRDVRDGDGDHDHDKNFVSPPPECHDVCRHTARESAAVSSFHGG